MPRAPTGRCVACCRHTSRRVFRRARLNWSKRTAPAPKSAMRSKPRRWRRCIASDQPEGTWCALGSVKSMVGHTKAAAGIAGLIKAALALEHKVLPPTIKVERPLEPIDPGKAPVYINAESRPWLPRAEHPRRAAVSAFGFGGSNFHCVLEEAGAAKAARRLG